MVRFLGIAMTALIINSCATQAPWHSQARNSSQFAGVAIGEDKADILRTFGAPTKIEIVNRRFRYTYYSNKSKVIIDFDANNKVSAINR